MTPHARGAPRRPTVPHAPRPPRHGNAPPCMGDATWTNAVPRPMAPTRGATHGHAMGSCGCRGFSRVGVGRDWARLSAGDAGEWQFCVPCVTRMHAHKLSSVWFLGLIKGSNSPNVQELRTQPPHAWILASRQMVFSERPSCCSQVGCFQVGCLMHPQMEMQSFVWLMDHLVPAAL